MLMFCSPLGKFLQHISHKVSLKPVIIDRRERHMVGLSTHFYGVDSERNNIGEKLPKLWDVFLPRMSEVADSLPSFGFGIVHNVEPEDELLEYFAAVEITSEPLEVPAEMSYLRIPAARYATFQHRGVPSEVCLLYTSPSPRDQRGSRMPSSA